jgi:hypothetical protein
MERSAPPNEQDEQEEGETSHQPSAPPISAPNDSNLMPSAPILDDDDEGLVDAVRRGRSTPSGQQNNVGRRSEALPEYQR